MPWNVEGTAWGSMKYVTPELLRVRGIGSGYFQNPNAFSRRPRGYAGGYSHDRNWMPMTDYHLEGYAPWNEWGGQGRYDELVKKYQTTVDLMSRIPQVGTQDDLDRLTELDLKARDYQKEARDLHGQGKSIQDDYIKKWLEAYDITYNPDAAVGSGRFGWDLNSKRGRDMAHRSKYGWGPGYRERGGHPDPHTRPHWSAWESRDQGEYADTAYRTINKHKWNEHELDSLRRFKLKPPEPPPVIKDPAVDKTTTANEYGSTTVDPMPNMDWFTESPRGAQGVATQRGLTGRRKDSKYGKSFKRGDRENSLTTDSLNI